MDGTFYYDIPAGRRTQKKKNNNNNVKCLG